MDQKYYIFPFADAGDKAAVPNDIEGDGSVSYEEGWGTDYELEQGVAPSAKDIPRPESNELMFDLTENVKQYQEHGTAEHITAADNDSVAFPYDLFARCIGLDGIVYESKIPNNTDVPPSDNWNVATFQGIRSPDWSRADSLGAPFNIAGLQDGALAPLGISAAGVGYQMAFVDGALEDLRVFDWSGTAYSTVGSVLNIPGLVVPAITTTATSRVALIDVGIKDLQMYGFNGTIFSTVGTALNLPAIGGAVSIATVRKGTGVDIDIALIDQTTENLAMYNWNGTTFSLVGTPLNISGIGAPTVIALSESIVIVDSGSKNAQAYFWNGSIFAPIGTSLVTGASAMAMVALNDTDFGSFSSSNAQLRVIRFNGAGLAYVGWLRVITGAGNGAMGAINGTDISFIDSTIEDLQSYRFNYSLGRPPSHTLLE